MLDSIGINESTSAPLKLSRSIRRGCLLVPLLYLFIIHCLGYFLDQDDLVEGILLPSTNKLFTNQEFRDDINLYLASNIQNLITGKIVLSIFCAALGIKIN